MSLNTTASLARATEDRNGSCEQVAKWGAACLMGMLVAFAVVLCWRRIAGHLETPLDGLGLLFAGSLLAVMAGAIRVVRPVAGRGDFPELSTVVPSALVTIVIVAPAWALSLPGTPWPGLLGLWVAILLEETWAWRRAFRRVAGHAIAPKSSRPASPNFPQAKQRTEIVEQEMPAEDIVQQFVRRRGPAGTESLSGLLRVSFAPGQRSATGHVAICPAFAQLPEVVAEQLEGPSARIKTAQVLPYGVRFDVKLAAPAGGAESVLLEFFAQTGSGGQRESAPAEPE